MTIRFFSVCKNILKAALAWEVYLWNIPHKTATVIRPSYSPNCASLTESNNATWHEARCKEGKSPPPETVITGSRVDLTLTLNTAQHATVSLIASNRRKGRETIQQTRHINVWTPCQTYSRAVSWYQSTRQNKAINSEAWWVLQCLQVCRNNYTRPNKRIYPKQMWGHVTTNPLSELQSQKKCKNELEILNKLVMSESSLWTINVF